MKRILLLTLCLGICLSGCGKNTGEQVPETPKEEVQLLTPNKETEADTPVMEQSSVDYEVDNSSTELSTQEELEDETAKVNRLREEYFSKINLDKLKETAVDLRTERVFDIQPYFNSDVFVMTDEMYEAKILHRDVTLFGTTLGALVDSLADTGLVQDYYDLSTVTVAPYHSVRMPVTTYTYSSDMYELGNKELSGSVRAVNLTEEPMLATDCIITGYDISCYAGTDIWGFDNNAVSKYMEAEDKYRTNDVLMISEEAENNQIKFNTYFYRDDKGNNDQFTTTFSSSYALDYLHANYEEAVSDTSAEFPFVVNGDTFDLNKLNYAQVVMNVHKNNSEPVFDSIPTVDLNSIFDFKDYEFVTLVTDTTGSLIESFNNYDKFSIHARINKEAGNVWSSLLTSISIDNDNLNAVGDVYINGILISGSEEDFVSTLQQYANSNGYEADITDGYEDDEQDVAIFTDGWRINATTSKPASTNTIEEVQWSKEY